jgi:hypothetical protein
MTPPRRAGSGVGFGRAAGWAWLKGQLERFELRPRDYVAPGDLASRELAGLGHAPERRVVNSQFLGSFRQRSHLFFPILLHVLQLRRSAIRIPLSGLHLAHRRGMMGTEPQC